MAQHTGQLVLQNGFADTITVFQQKVEDVVLPEKVDVLVSEWMGTCLLVRAGRVSGWGHHRDFDFPTVRHLVCTPAQGCDLLTDDRRFGLIKCALLMVAHCTLGLRRSSA